MPIAALADWSEPRVAIRGAVELHGVSLVVDARLDNHRDLEIELGLGPDASVGALVAKAYLNWGEACADRLTGDFAFVVFDKRRQRLVAARDPFGVRSLFYRTRGPEVWLASRVETILETFDARPELDNGRVVEYLLERYASTSATFFRDIRELPGGNVLVATPTGVTCRPYWTPPPPIVDSGKTGRAEYLEEFRRLFVQSVRRRLVSTGPVMIHVSGGLDSSTIAGAADLLSREGASPAPGIVGVAALYPGLSCDESPFIDAVARHVSFPIEPWDGTRAEDTDLTHPEPSAPGIRTIFRGGTIGDIAIARAHGGSVILSGVGGDQLGTVDGVVRDLIADGHWSAGLGELLLFPGATVSTRLDRLRYLAKQFVPPAILRRRALSRARAPAWLAPELRTLAASLAWRSPTGPDGLSHVHRNLWQRLTSPHLARAVSMRGAHAQLHGVEYRFPFLDRDLVRFTFTIPGRCWPRPRGYERLHREALRDLVPSEIGERLGKAEFTPALANRVRLANDHIGALFEVDGWASSNFVDRAQSLRAWRAVAAGRAEDVPSAQWREVWSMATIEAWLRRIFEYYLVRSNRRDGRGRQHGRPTGFG